MILQCMKLYCTQLCDRFLPFGPYLSFSTSDVTCKRLSLLLQVFKQKVKKHAVYKIRDHNTTKQPFDLYLSEYRGFISIYKILHPFSIWVSAAWATVINDLNFGTAFGQSKLESHTNYVMKTAQNWSIVCENSMIIE